MSYTKQIKEKQLTSPISFDDLVRQAYEGLAFLNGYQKISFNFTSSCNGAFFANEKLLQIILTSLFANGISSRDSGKLENLISVSIVADDDKAIITVRDNGKGIDDNEVSRLFDFNFQKPHHAAFSMYLAGESIKKLNGKMLVESAPGQGTEFSLEIPNLFTHSDVTGKPIETTQKYFH